ncbi:MAG: hypothetical protein R3B99_08515 [Polyangiales bacterium]
MLGETTAAYLRGEASADDVRRSLRAVAARDATQAVLGRALLGDERDEAAALGAELLRRFAAEHRRRLLHEGPVPAQPLLDDALVLLVLASRLSVLEQLRLLRELAKARVDVSAAFELANHAWSDAGQQKPETHSAAGYALDVLCAVYAWRGDWSALDALGDALGANAIRVQLEDLPAQQVRDAACIVLLRRFRLYGLWTTWALNEGDVSHACDVVLESGAEGAACARVARKLASEELVRSVVARADESPEAAGHFLAEAGSAASLDRAVPTDVLRRLAHRPECRPHVLSTLARLCGLRGEALDLPVELLAEAVVSTPEQAGALLAALRFESGVPTDIRRAVEGLLRAKSASSRASASWFFGRHPRALDAKVVSRLCALCGDASADVREAAAWALACAAEAGHDITGAEKKLVAAVAKRRARDDEAKIAANVSAACTLGDIRHARGEANDEVTRLVWLDGLFSSSESLALGAAHRIERELSIDPGWAPTLRASIRPSDDPVIAGVLRLLG